jgi:hypothetical protein
VNEKEPGVYRENGEWVVIPEKFGPTWTEDPNWDGIDEKLRYILPEKTLGYEILEWIPKNLLNDDGEPFTLTAEQKRFMLWWYAVDQYGFFTYRDGIFQRLKGHGKDPLVAVISAVEFVGPCRFSHWATERISIGVGPGDPVAKPHPRAWIQIAAVSLFQTQNTMKIFPGLFTAACMKKHKINMGKETIYAYDGQRTIQAVTSSPASLEGGRATFVVRNETHHWLANNDGHAMAEVIERNATKSKDGAARALSITNAYEPSQDSVAQQQREAWEDENAGLFIETGVLYDTIEAPKDAKLLPPKANKDDPDPTDEEIIEYIGAIIKAVRGDSVWLNVDRIVKSILDRKNKQSTSRRFWYNQVVAAEDAWVDPDAVDRAIDRLAVDSRMSNRDEDGFEAGWLLEPDEECVLFLDCSKSDDSTALIMCSLETGDVYTAGVWQKPRGDRGKGWLAPREKVDARVNELFDRFKIVAFWGDPSHALDDDDSSRYWDGYFDRWHRKYKDRLVLWAMKTGDRAHSVMWDMTSPTRIQMFVQAAETFVEEMENLNDIEEYEPLFRIDGHPALVKHLGNAKKFPGKFGTSLMKEGRESPKKIDLAVCAVGARMLRRLVLNRGVDEDEKPGEVWGHVPTPEFQRARDIRRTDHRRARAAWN